jgi:hypothetical protein
VSRVVSSSAFGEALVMRSWVVHRWLVVSAVAVAGLVVVAAPATAQPPAVIGVSIPDVAIPSGSKPATMDVRLDVPADARDLTVAIDVSGLANIATVRPPLPGCTTTDDTITCPVTGERRRGFPLTIGPAGGVPTRSPVRQTGTLTIRASASNVPPGSHTATVTVGQAVVDAAAIGSTATGKVGDTVKVTFGVRNNGPGSLSVPLPVQYNIVASFAVTMPPGVTVLTPDQPFGGCGRTGKPREFGCLVRREFPAGGVNTFTLDVRIDRPLRNAIGTVRASADAVDPNPANNTATIVINPGPPLPAPGLPVTGTRTATLAATGALLAVLGTIALTLARRRRHRFTAGY